MRYLGSYPQLAAFLAQHPEIPQNASYYLETRSTPATRAALNPQERLELLGADVAGFAALHRRSSSSWRRRWLIRTILDQRRWNRLSKIQAEVHTKLMDRFSSNEELLAYVQTAAGAPVPGVGPSPLDRRPRRTIGAPFTRILWSVQVGVVLAIVGIGLLYVSEPVDLGSCADVLRASASSALAAGAGFVVSAVAAYLALPQARPARTDRPCSRRNRVER